jgi:hypothetical protein
LPLGHDAYAASAFLEGFYDFLWGIADRRPYSHAYNDNSSPISHFMKFPVWVLFSFQLFIPVESLLDFFRDLKSHLHLRQADRYLLTSARGAESAIRD